MPRPVHFELAADDPDRAARFYAGVFGWESELWAGPQEYRLLTTGPDGCNGINGAITRRSELMSGTTNVIAVEDLDTCLAGVALNGGTVAAEPREVPGIGRLAYCRDTEGNLFGVLQPDMPES